MNYQMWLGLGAGGAVYVAVRLAPWIWAQIARIKTGTTDGEVSEVEAFEALNLLKKRERKRECKAGIKAINEYAKHFATDAEEEVTSA